MKKKPPQDGLLQNGDETIQQQPSSPDNSQRDQESTIDTHSPSSKQSIQGKINFRPLKKKPKVVSAMAFTGTPRKFKSPDKTITRALTVVQTRDGCIIAEISTSDGRPCYNKHITDFINDDPRRAAADHGIDTVAVHRHKLDPTEIWKEVIQHRGRELTKMRNLFINYNFRSNMTKEYRINWAKHIVDLHNTPKFQKQLFGSNNKAFFAGDITPEKERPYLSEFLTIRRTIIAIKDCFDKALDDLIGCDALLKEYFPLEMFEQVREFYRTKYKNSSDYRMPHESDYEDESPIPKFEP